MFTRAPERLIIRAVADTPIAGTDRRIRASRVTGAGAMVKFAEPPEFPARIDDAWLREHVPAMPESQFERLIVWLRAKRWTDAELATRVYPVRGH